MSNPYTRAHFRKQVAAAGAIVEVEMYRGQLEESVIVTHQGDVTLTTAGTGVKPFASMLKSVQLVADNGKVLCSWLAEDLIVEQIAYEQAPLAALVSPPGAATIATHSFRATHQIAFKEPFADQADLSLLPTQLYQVLTLRLIFGGVTDLFYGGAVGTFANVTADVVQNGYIKYEIPGATSEDDVQAFLMSRARSIRFYDNLEIPGASPRVVADLKRTNPVRSLILRAYDNAGVPSDGIVDSLILKLNSSLEQVSEVPWHSVRARNASVFGVTMPVGTAILDSAEDRDITDLYDFHEYTKVELFVKSLAAGSLRIAYKAFEPGA